MANETLTLIAESMKQLTDSIATAKELISALSEAGEDTTKLSQDLRALEVRKAKWDSMLKNRGL